MAAEENRIMLGFVVRQCAVALGHSPTPEELADWANRQRPERVFGREITPDEARVMLQHPGRMVTVRSMAQWGFAVR